MDDSTPSSSPNPVTPPLPSPWPLLPRNGIFRPIPERAVGLQQTPFPAYPLAPALFPTLSPQAAAALLHQQATRSYLEQLGFMAHLVPPRKVPSNPPPLLHQPLVPSPPPLPSPPQLRPVTDGNRRLNRCEYHFCKFWPPWACLTFKQSATHHHHNNKDLERSFSVNESYPKY